MLYLGIFGLEFYNTIVIFEIRTLKFVELQDFRKKKKCLDMESKTPYFRFSWTTILKNYAIFEISTLIFLEFPNFLKKQKSLNFEPKMPCFGIFGLEFKNTIVIV